MSIANTYLTQNNYFLQENDVNFLTTLFVLSFVPQKTTQTSLSFGGTYMYHLTLKEYIFLQSHANLLYYTLIYAVFQLEYNQYDTNSNRV